MIHSITIRSLFGVKGRDYDITFKRPYTIMVGRNGSGKTTVLNILHAIASKQFHLLLQYRFERIQVTINDARISVEPVPNGLVVKRDDVNITDILKKHKSRIPNAVAVLEQFRAEPSALTSIVSTLFSEHGSTVWPLIRDISRYFLVIPRELREFRGRLSRSAIEWDVTSFDVPGEILYFPTYRRLEANLQEIELRARREHWLRPTAEWVQEIREVSSQTGIVFGHSGDDVRDIVASKLRELNNYERERLNRLIKDYVLEQLSVDLDLQLTPIPERELARVEASLKEVFARTGLMQVSSEMSCPDRIAAYFATVREASTALAYLSQLQDTQLGSTLAAVISFQLVKKLVTLYEKASRDIASRRAVVEKMKVTLERLLEKEVVLAEDKVGIKTADGTVVDFEELSSGEKQLLALFVYTRLAMKKDATVLIDEPELSLHVEWQRRLLQALIDRDTNAQFIIATHSPFVIGPVPESIVPLGEPGDGV